MPFEFNTKPVTNPYFRNHMDGHGIFHIKMMPSLAADYVAEMETQRTNEWCKCEWLIHPDDTNLDIHNCRTCQHPALVHNVNGCTKEVAVTVDDEEWDDECPCMIYVEPPKRRMRRGDQHPHCPVHTREGFLLGFFEWVVKKNVKN